MPVVIPPADLERWQAAYAASGRTSPFQSPAWLLYLYNRHASGEPWPVTLHHGFAPLVRERKGLFGSVRLAGGDYEDIVCAPGEEAAAVADLADAMDGAGGWLTANFRALREDSALLTGWRALPPGRWSAQLIPHRVHKYVALPATWAEYEPVLGKKLAYKLRAAAGRRDKAFTSNELRRANAETLEQDLDALFLLHQSRWEERGETGVFVGEAEMQAFRMASQALLASGELWLYTLWLDGKPASALYCLADRRAVYYYIGGIDITHQKHHPGKVLIGQAIKDAIEAGLKEFDFLSGLERYKDDWANAERTVYRLIVGRGLVGRAIVRAFGPIDAQLRKRKAAREARKAAAWTKTDAGTLEE